MQRNAADGLFTKSSSIGVFFFYKLKHKKSYQQERFVRWILEIIPMVAGTANSGSIAKNLAI